MEEAQCFSCAESKFQTVRLKRLPPAKLSFRNKEEMKTFSHKGKSTAKRCSVEEQLKEVIQTEIKFKILN